MCFEDILYLFHSDRSNRKFIRLNLLESGALFKVAQKSIGNILEIGSRYGGSATLLSAAIGNDRKVFSIDIVHPSSTDYGKRLISRADPNLLSKIEFITCESVSLSNTWDRGQFGLIFIDAKHTPKAVSADISAWKPFLSANGYMIFHDIGENRGHPNPKWKKIRKLLERTVNKKLKDEFTKVDHVETLAIFQKN